MAEEIRDFVDRSLRELLLQPEILRDFVTTVAGDLAAGFDFEQMRPAPQEFLVGNFRQRAPDVLLEIPYRTEEQEGMAFVCVLLEHQTRTEKLIPLKMNTYASAYWEWQWRTWETRPTPKPDFQLTPIFPLVLHTGPRPWGSARSLRELLAPPSAFHRFVADLQPIFWDLATHPPEELLAQAPFMQALTILKADSEPLPAAQALFRQIYACLDPLHDNRSVLWQRLVRFMLGWTQNKRPREERADWHTFACNLQSDADRRREIETMGQTIAEALIEEGEQRGIQKGEQRVMADALKRSLRFFRQLGIAKFGSPDEETTKKLDAVSSLDILDSLEERLHTATSWTELFRTEE